MIKRAGVWKIANVPGDQDREVEKNATMMAEVAKLVEKVANEVEKREFKSAEEAMSALHTRMVAALKK